MNQGISRFRKAGIGALTALTATAGLIPLASGAGATASFSTTRYAGADRYDTAKLIAEGTFGTADNVLIATGQNFPDALAGNFYAGFKAGPVLLTEKASVPAITKTALQNLKAKNVTILGLTDAVSAAVENDLKDDASTNAAGGNLVVTRIGGADRYETARLLATASGTTVGSVDGAKTAIVATGDKFPDALSAGPGAYANNLPVILTNGAPSTTLNSHAKAALEALAIKNVIIMGGEAAITSQTETAIKALNGGITTARQSGADRTETARLFAEYALSKLGFLNSHANLGRGDNFPDALTGGPHGGKAKAPNLLSQAPTVLDPGNIGACKYAKDHASTLTTGHVFGGTAAISDAVKAEFETCGGKTATAANQTVTTRPELASAAIISTTTAGNATPTNPAGTIVRYTFDEPISAAIPSVANFKVYDYTNPNTGIVPGVGGTATVNASDPKSVDVLFPSLNTATSVANLSVATVVAGAVTDLQGQTSPAGDAGIGTAHAINQTAGATSTPDLVSIGNFRQAATTGTTAVDFVFDQAAFLVTTTGFHVILNTGVDVVCTTPATTDTVTPAGGTSPGGNGTTTISVTCADAAATPTTPYTAAQVARGTVDLGSVKGSPTATATNPLEASNTPHGSSTSPSLVSATFNPSTTTTTGTVIYTFDQPVLGIVGANTLFHVYNASGTQFNAQAAPVPVASTANPNQVAATFLNSELVGAVGASVEDAAVSNTTTGANQQDEVGVANANSTTVTPDRTAGPDLTAVTLTAVKDTFGTTTGYSATFTFDQAIGTASTPPTAIGAAGSFVLYDADGTALSCAATPVYTGSTSTNSVTCQVTGTLGQQQTAVLGTVAAGAITDSNGLMNPEGANPTTGGTGTPAA